MAKYDIDPETPCNCGCGLTYREVVQNVMHTMCLNSEQAQHCIDQSTFRPTESTP